MRKRVQRRGACRKPGEELLLSPTSSGKSLRILEQGNYRTRAQKGWAERHWRQGERPEIQV